MFIYSPGTNEVEMMRYRNGWLLNGDTHYIRNAVFVSCMCGLTESVTVANYDNYTIFVMGILSYYYVHSLVY